MNIDNLHSIFDKYVDCFDKINDAEHREYCKLQIANQFAALFDDALSSDDVSFPTKLKEIKKMTENLIDSYTSPFYGLCKIAEKEPQSVKKLFTDLFSYKMASVQDKQRGLESFIARSNSLVQKYYLDSFMYTNDLHSASSFLFFYDPDDNYLFKPSHCREFSDCIGFPEDWGTKESFDLSAFYRMCDQVVREIRKYPTLVKVNRSLYDGRYMDTLYPDNEFHVFLFDIIFCCSTYGLFDGIQFVRRTRSKKTSDIENYRKKAEEAQKEAEKWQREMEPIFDFQNRINQLFEPGIIVPHTEFGAVEILDNQDGIISIKTKAGEEKKLDLIIACVNHLLKVQDIEINKEMAEKRELLLNHRDIRRNYILAANRAKQYSEFN